MLHTIRFPWRNFNLKLCHGTIYWKLRFFFSPKRKRFIFKDECGYTERILNSFYLLLSSFEFFLIPSCTDIYKYENAIKMLVTGIENLYRNVFYFLFSTKLRIVNVRKTYCSRIWSVIRIIFYVSCLALLVAVMWVTKKNKKKLNIMWLFVVCAWFLFLLPTIYSV